jgi:hypothetical protein
MSKEFPCVGISVPAVGYSVIRGDCQRKDLPINRETNLEI